MGSQEYKYERAKKRAKALRGFYRHIRVFVIINGMLYLIKGGFFNWTLPKDVTLASYYFDWIDIHLIIWIAILLIHAGIVFVWQKRFLNNWEERKIKEFMEKDKKPF